MQGLVALIMFAVLVDALDEAGGSIGTEGAQADKLKEKTIAIFNSQVFFIFTS